MDEFTRAARALHHDPALSEPCTYQPPAGAPLQLRAIVYAREGESEIFLTPALLGTYRATVLLEDLPAPEEGAELAVAPADGGGLEYAGHRFRVRNALLDPEGTIWTLGLDLLG